MPSSRCDAGAFLFSQASSAERWNAMGMGMRGAPHGEGNISRAEGVEEGECN
jgi:hypothetical protein